MVAVVPIYWIGEDGSLADTQPRASPEDSSARISPIDNYNVASPELGTSSYSIEDSDDPIRSTFQQDSMLEEYLSDLTEYRK